MAVEMNAQEALNGIYNMLAVIMEQQTNNNSKESKQQTSATDQTITSLLKGIIETNSADKIKSTGEALEALAKGVTAFADTSRTILKEVSSSLLILNNTLSIISSKDGLPTNIDNLLEVFNKLGSIDIEDARNFTTFIQNLSVENPKEVQKNAKAISAAIQMLNNLISIDIKKLIKNLKLLNKNKYLTKSITEFINELHNSITSKKTQETSVKTAQAIGTLLDGISKFANTSLWNLYKTFNPITGRIVGKEIISFLNALFNVVNKKIKASDKQIKAIGELLSSIAKIGSSKNFNIDIVKKTLNKKNAKAIGQFFNVLLIELTKNTDTKQIYAASEAVNKILDSLLKITIAKILTIKLMSTVLTPKVGVNLAKFFTNLFKIKVTKEQAANAKTVIDTFVKLTYAMLISVAALALIITLLPTSSLMLAMGSLYILTKLAKNTIKDLSKISFTKAKDADKISHSISILFLSLTASLTILILISKLATWKDIVSGVLLFTTVVTAGILIINLLNPKKLKLTDKEMNNVINTVRSISLLFLAISVSLSILILTVKNAKPSEIFSGIGIVMVFLVAAIGAIWMLSKIKHEDLETASNALLKISAVYAIISLVSLLLIIPIGKKADEILVGNIVILGTMAGLIGLLIFLDKAKESIDDGIWNMAKIILVYTVISLVMLTLIIPLGKQFKEILLGTLTVIGTMFALIGILTILSKMKDKDLTNGLIATGVIFLILLGVSLITKELIIPIGKQQKEAWGGLAVIATIFAGLIGIVYLLSSNSLQKRLAKSYVNLIQLAITTVLLSLATGLIINAAIKAGEKNKETLIGLGIITLIIAGTTGIVYLLNKIEIEKLVDGAIILAGLSLLIGLLGICMDPIINVAIKAGQNDGVLKGLGLCTLILGATLGLVLAVGAIVGNPAVSTVLITGGIVLAGVAGVILMVSGMINSIVDMVDKVKGIDKKLISDSGTKLVSLFDILFDTIYAAAPNPFQMIQIAAVLTNLPQMLLIIAGVKSIAKTISRIIKEINTDDIVKFKEIAIGKDNKDPNSLIGALYSIVDAFNQFGLGSALYASIIAGAVRPVINTLSQFIDVVKKIATLSYVSGYDKNGKPIFDHLNPSVFKDAAVAVSEGFGTFLNTLKDAFSGFGVLSLIVVKLIGKGLNPIVDTVSKFVDIVIKVAKMQIVTGYDKNGKPIFETVPVSTFSAAAKSVSENFKLFLENLGDGMKSLDISARIAIDSVKKTMKPVMDAVAKFVDTVIKVATMQIVTGYDEKDHPIYEQIDVAKFTEAAVSVSLNFGIFLIALAEGMKSLDYRTVDAMNSIRKSIAPVMKGVSSFVDAIVKLASAQIPDNWDSEGKPIHFKEISKTEYENAAKVIAEQFGVFLKQITSSFTSGWFITTTDDALEAIAESIGPVMEGITKWVDAIYKLASGVIEYDKWDEKTKSYIKIRGKISDDDYEKAAKRITDSFTAFITTITDTMTDDVIKKAEKAKDAIKESINPIMDAVLKFSQALEPFLSIQDKDAKTVDAKYLAAKPGFVKNIATEIANSFVSFISIISDEFSNEKNQEKYASIARITPTITKTLNHINNASSKLRNIIKSFTDDKNQVITTGELVAQQFIKTLNAIINFEDKTANDYFNAKDTYIEYINPMLQQANRSADYLKNIITLIKDENINYKETIGTFNGLLNSIATNAVSINNRIKDLDFLTLRQMVDTYQHMAQKLTYISNYMVQEKDLTTGISIFLDNIDKLTNKEINANIIATGGNIKIYVDRLVSLTSQIKVTTKTIKIYVTEIDKAREALKALDKQIIDNEKARNNALQTFADKVNNIAKAVTNLKDSFDALNENKILSQFNNIRNILNTINDDIDTVSNGTITVNNNVVDKNKSISSGQKSNNSNQQIIQQQAPLFGNNIKVEFIIDGRTVSGFMNVVPK